MADPYIGPQDVICFRNPDFQDCEPIMKFRLVYEGKLLSSQPSDNKNLTKKEMRLTKHKHEIRKELHKQLSSLWHKHQTLSTLEICKSCKKNHAIERDYDPIDSKHEPVGLSDFIIAEIPGFQSQGYTFCPLVSEALDLQCSLSILLLRQDEFSGVYRSGDLDNRIKTLIDGLTMPDMSSDFIQHYPKPDDDETPFYTLMRDDNIIGGLKVESDIRHAPGPDNINDPAERAWVTALIEVEIRPRTPNNINLSFV